MLENIEDIQMNYPQKCDQDTSPAATKRMPQRHGSTVHVHFILYMKKREEFRTMIKITRKKETGQRDGVAHLERQAKSKSYSNYSIHARPQKGTNILAKYQKTQLHQQAEWEILYSQERFQVISDWQEPQPTEIMIKQNI